MEHYHWIGSKTNGEGEVYDPAFTCNDTQCSYPEVLPSDFDSAATTESPCDCCGEPANKPKYSFSKQGWEGLCLRCRWADSSCPKGNECLGIEDPRMSIY